MKTTFFSLLLLFASASAGAGVVHFDDLPGGDGGPIAHGYQGFAWDNLGVIGPGADGYAGSGFAAGAVSPANVAYNRDGATAAVSSMSGFNFVGAYFTSAWLEQELAFDGWRNGELLYSTSVSYLIDTATPRWIALGWSGIDTLTIYNSSGTQWAMDEVTVPEPGSLGLLGACLASLALVRRRQGPHRSQPAGI